MVSFCTECPLPTLSIYTATKAALMSLTNGMRMELLKYGVEVILFNPGDFPGETPLCFGQSTHYNAMEKEVKQRFAPSVYEDFEAYRGKFVSIFPGKPKINPLKSPGLYKNFDMIIKNHRIHPHYVNSGIFTRLYFGFLKMVPVGLSDKLRLGLMRLPK